MSATPVLHHELCSNRAEDITRMQNILEKWRGFYKPETDLNPALVHAVEKGHDMCVNFLYSLGATGNVRDLLKIATRQSRPAVFEVLLQKGCTKDDINFISSEFRNIDSEDDIVKLIIERNFSFEPSDLKSDTRIHDFLYRTFHHLSGQCMSYSSRLKYFLMSGGVVDYRQLPCENLTQDMKDQVSLIHNFIQISTDSFSAHNEDSSNFPVECYSKALYILRQCGANFAENNAHGKSLLDVIEVNREAAKTCEDEAEPEEDEPDEFMHIVEYCDELISKIQEYLSEPLSLKSLSRLTLIRHLKVRYLKSVNNLSPSQYPQDLINFLKGDDMKVNEFYTVSEKERLSVMHRIWEYEPLIDKYLNSQVLPLEMRNKLRSKYSKYDSNGHNIDEIDVLNKELRKLQICGQIIMKFIYNI